MNKKEIVTKDNLIEVLDLLDSMEMKYWIDGGWGVDILLGKQNREHRDIDVDFDGEFTKALLYKLKEKGYEIVVDWSPSRIELYHPGLGYIDIHPLMYDKLFTEVLLKCGVNLREADIKDYITLMKQEEQINKQ